MVALRVFAVDLEQRDHMKQNVPFIHVGLSVQKLKYISSSVPYLSFNFASCSANTLAEIETQPANKMSNCSQQSVQL